MASLEDYELGRALARGGMGVVHEAVERATGRAVAIKRILPSALEGDAVARFLLEGQAVARLSHPGIVAVHALGEADGAPFLVMDLVAGESLERRLARGGRLPLPEVVAVVRQVARALEHAHARGVLHRDLKPANVLVDDAGAARLIDFGLAKLVTGRGSLERLTRTGELLGTPAFMAPEQANGGEVDARTDVYGLGATAYALLTGRPPFEGATLIAVLEGVLSRAPAAPSRLEAGVDPALDALVLACLEKAPARRPASMSELLARLAEVEPGRPRPGRGLVLALGLAAALSLASLAGALAHRARGAADGVAAPSSPTPPSPTPSSPTPSPTTPSPATPSPPTTTPDRPDDPLAWLELARGRARGGDVEGALRPPPPGAPAAAWLANGLALTSAERFDAACAALNHPSLARSSREVILARFCAAVGRDPRSADPAPLGDEVSRDPPWPEGLYARELHRQRTAPTPDRFQGALARLRAWGRDDLAACLEAERLLDGAWTPGPVAESLRALDAALERAPSLRAQLVRGDLRIAARRVAEGEADLDAVLARDPLLARAHRGLARARRQVRDLDRAADALRRVALLVGASDGGDAARAAAELLLEVHRPGDALAVLPPPLSSALVERCRGLALAGLGRPEDGAAVLRRALTESAQGEPLAYYSLAEALQGLGRPYPEWDRRCLDALRRADGGDPTRWLRAADLFAMLDSPAFDAAVQGAIERGAEPAARAKRARKRSAQGRTDDALADWDWLVERAPGDGWARLARAVARAAGGRRDAALADLDLAEVALAAPSAPDALPDLDVVDAMRDASAAERLAPGRFKGLVARLDRRSRTVNGR